MIAFLQRIRNLFQSKWIQSKDNPYVRYRYEPSSPSMENEITIDQLLQCMPGLTHDRAVQHLTYLNDAMEKYDIATPLRQSHFLCQLGHESMSLRYSEELASGEAYEHRADLGNLNEGDGKRYKGRGFIQITGRANYRQYSFGKDINFEENPRLLSEEPWCSDSAGWFWQMHSLNVIADTDNIQLITRRINGGLNGLPDREQRLALCRRALMVNPS